MEHGFFETLNFDVFTYLRVHSYKLFLCNLLLCIVSITFGYDNSLRELKVKTICCLISWGQDDLSV